MFRIPNNGEPIASIVLLVVRSLTQMTEPEVQTINVILIVFGTEIWTIDKYVPYILNLKGCLKFNKMLTN